MLKILDKYKKYVLAVGGSLLMVAFIMPSAMSQLRGDPGKRVVAYVGDEKIRAREFAKAHGELTALSKAAPLLVSNLGIRQNDDLHWFLLSTQAERAGLVGAEGDGDLFVSEDLPQVLAVTIARARRIPDFYLQQQGVWQQLVSEGQKAAPNFVEAARRDSHLTPQEMSMAFAKLRGALRLEQAYQQAARLSERRLKETAKFLVEFVGVDTVVVPASRLIDSVKEPTEAELAEHFAKYRDIVPGTGDNGIGYRQPNRVKLGWLFLDHLAISDSVKVDAVEANKRWRKENPAKPAEEFAKDRAEIEKKMKEEKVASIMAQVDKIWRAQVQQATRRLDADGPYKKLPADWATSRPSLEAIARAIVEDLKVGTGVDIPQPAVVVRDASWLTMRDVQRIPGIGQAQVTIGNATGSAAELVFTSRELLEKQNQPPTGVAVQAGLPIADAYAADAKQNRYYVMVLDAKKAAAPETLDEIRGEVVKGYKTIVAYETLKKDSESYENTAKSDGLDAIAKMFEIPQDTPPEADLAPVDLVPDVLVSRDQVRGNDARIRIDAFRDAALAIGDTLNPLVAVDTVPKDKRTFRVMLPKSLAVAIGQVSKLEPLTEEYYRQVGEALVRRKQDMEFEKTMPKEKVDNPFSVASLKTQLNFRMVKGDIADREEKKGEGDEQTPDEDVAPADAMTK